MCFDLSRCWFENRLQPASSKSWISATEASAQPRDPAIRIRISCLLLWWWGKQDSLKRGGGRHRPVRARVTPHPHDDDVAGGSAPRPGGPSLKAAGISQGTLPAAYAESEWKTVYDVLDPNKKGKRARLARQQVVSYSRKDDLLYYHHDGRDNPVLVVPAESMQHAIVEYVHDTIMGHTGVVATVARIRQQFWWTRMAQMVRKHVRHCKQCNRHQPRTARPYMNMQRLTHYAMDRQPAIPIRAISTRVS
eukprot:COSAG01_NODE_38_length_33931_cov_75.163632_15_plen_249_part_00